MNQRDLVLHGAAIKRHAPAAAIAHFIGLPENAVATELATAVATGRAIESPGGFALTLLAGIALQARYGMHFAELRADADFIRAYEAFERVNVQLKQVITDWQTITVGGQSLANDHRDEAYDGRVIDRLGQIHEQAEPILAALSAKLPRMASYTVKLLGALEQAEDGETEWVSDIRRDSYHTVWFELHEDLLRIVGREREE